MSDPGPPSSPTLNDLLRNSTLGTYSLECFRAFLVQNHCLELLNFLQEAEGYRESYFAVCVQLGPISHHSCERPEVEELLVLWQHLASTYILPGSSQEIDVMNYERNYLPTGWPMTPPPPDVLDSVVRRLENLLGDDILPAFLYNQSENTGWYSALVSKRFCAGTAPCTIFVRILLSRIEN